MSTVLHSRKFWALVVAVVAAAAALATGAIAPVEALQLAVQAIMVYIGAVAIEDGLRAGVTASRTAAPRK